MENFHGQPAYASKAGSAADGSDRQEIDLIFAQMSRRHLLIAQMRLIKRAQMRVKDIDFQRREITIRHGKGSKGRHTTLRLSLVQSLRDQLVYANSLYKEGRLYQGRNNPLSLQPDGLSALQLQATMLPQYANTQDCTQYPRGCTESYSAHHANLSGKPVLFIWQSYHRVLVYQLDAGQAPINSTAMRAKSLASCSGGAVTVSPLIEEAPRSAMPEKITNSLNNEKT